MLSNIVVCFYNHKDVDVIRSLLSRNGHRVAYSCVSGARALEACDRLGSGILICGYRMSDMIFSELCRNMPESFDMLLIASPAARNELCGAGRISMLELPLRASEFSEGLRELEQRRESLRRERKKKQRLGRSGRTPEELRLISEAKEKLMEEKGIGEEEAHRYLQRMAMVSGTGLLETARKYMLL